MIDDIEVNFPYPTKRSTRGYSSKVPPWLKPTFELYKSQLPDKSPDDTIFLKNWTRCKDGKGRKLNMGIHSIGEISKLVAAYLGKKGTYPGHSLQRSCATILAETGISIVSICHAGGWSSVKTA